jgi:hypothetical protein
METQICELIPYDAALPADLIAVKVYPADEAPPGPAIPIVGELSTQTTPADFAAFARAAAHWYADCEDCADDATQDVVYAPTARMAEAALDR